jgi:glycosyltransferase involved in cell wall biosynthesis
MACGTPVLGVAEGGVPESVLDGVTGRLTPRDPAAFATALVEMLNDPGALRRLGEHGQAHVWQNWSWEGSTAQLETHLLATAEGKVV